MSHLEEQISEALTHGPDTLTYILAQALTTARARVAELEARPVVVPEHLLHGLAMAAWDAGADAGIVWCPDADRTKRGTTPLTPEEGIENARAHFAKHGSGSPNSEFGRALQAIRDNVHAIPADRVLGEGMVAVDREDVRLAIKELDLLWPCDRVKRMRGRFFDALRANQGGAAT